MTKDEANLFAIDIGNYIAGTQEFLDNPRIRASRQHESSASDGEFVELVIRIPYTDKQDDEVSG